MGLLPHVDGSTGSAEPVGQLAASVRATGGGPASLGARWLSLSGGVFAGEWR